MTMDEFFKELEAKCRHLPWVGKQDVLRTLCDSTCGTTYCPVTALTKSLTQHDYPSTLYRAAAVRISLSQIDAAQIVHAADLDYGHDPGIRKRLEVALFAAADPNAAAN